MIEHVRTIGFKGSDMNEPVPGKVIYCGKNKSGKSSRAEAIALAVYGHIPWSNAGKKPAGILDSFGKESLIVAVKINGTEFARKFSRTSKGVSQVVQIDKKKVSSETFAIALSKSGTPTIANTAEFMKQSEAKKVDTLFELFPNDALADIDTEIEKAKEDVSRLTKKKDGAESTVIRLTKSKTEIPLPPGSIAETQNKIKAIDQQITDIELDIKAAEIKGAELKAEQKGKEEGERQTLEKIENSKQPFVDENEYYGGAEHFQQEPSQPGHLINKLKDLPNPVESIQRIIGALKGSGCETCAALIVAKQELKKYV